MDLLINPTPDNSARVARALTSLPSVNSSALTSETFTRLGLQVPLKQYYHAELLTPRLDGVAYEEAAKHATIAKLFGVSVRLAAVEPLIQMKKLAAASDERSRQKHLADIERLKSQL
jgi:hypothetical protein